GVDKYFYKVSDFFSYLVTNLAIWRDCRNQCNDPISCQKIRNEGNPADVLVAVGLRVAEIGAKMLPNAVAIHDLHSQSTGKQLHTNGVCDCRFEVMDGDSIRK